MRIDVADRRKTGRKHNKPTTMNTSQQSKFVDLMSDAGFKAVLADKNNKHLLIALLNFLLPEGVVVSDIVSYEDRERSAMTSYGKKVYLDLVCKGEDGSLYNVEVQRVPQDRFFERCVYYASEMFYTELTGGQGYEDLRPVYVISLLDFSLSHTDESLWDSDHIVSRYNLREERSGEEGHPTIFIIFAELGRFTKGLEECRSEREYLFHWFKRGWTYEDEPEAFVEKPLMQELVRACEISAFEGEKRRKYDETVMNERDLRNMIKTAGDKMFAEGEAKGKLESARKMVEAGADPAFVANALGIDKSLLAL